jgi:hypothetical protein
MASFGFDLAHRFPHPTANIVQSQRKQQQRHAMESLDELWQASAAGMETPSSKADAVTDQGELDVTLR